MSVSISDEMRTFYINTYKLNNSVSEVMRLANDGVSRSRIVSILKKAEVYEGYYVWPKLPKTE
jgi:hypothetical protein